MRSARTTTWDTSKRPCSCSPAGTSAYGRRDADGVSDTRAHQATSLTYSPSSRPPSGQGSGHVDSGVAGWPSEATHKTTLRSGRLAYSHSMVPGGLLVTSSVTRLISRTSLVMRVEILAIKS